MAIWDTYDWQCPDCKNAWSYRDSQCRVDGTYAPWALTEAGQKQWREQRKANRNSIGYGELPKLTSGEENEFLRTIYKSLELPEDIHEAAKIFSEELIDYATDNWRPKHVYRIINMFRNEEK